MDVVTDGKEVTVGGSGTRESGREDILGSLDERWVIVQVVLGVEVEVGDMIA